MHKIEDLKKYIPFNPPIRRGSKIVVGKDESST